MRTLRKNETFESKCDRERRSMRAFRKLPVVRNSHLHLVKNTRDAESQLKNGTYPGTNNFTELVYNGTGHLAKIVETTSGSVTSTKQLIWCGNRICEERDASGAVVAKFFALGERVGSTNYFYEKDHLGSIVGVVNSSGVEVTSIRHDAWDKPTISGSYTPSFGFAGKHQRSGLNLTLFRACSTPLGRWLSRDPIGENGGVNLTSGMKLLFDHNL